MWGPCFGHKRAMSCPFLRSGLQDTPRNVKRGMAHPLAHWLRFWKNQFEWPCGDHVLAIKGPYFCPFWEKGTMGYTKKCEIWHGASLGTLIMIQEEQIWRTRWGPCFGHKGVIFWPFLGLVIHSMVKWKTRHSCRPLVLFSVISWPLLNVWLFLIYWSWMKCVYFYLFTLFFLLATMLTSLSQCLYCIICNIKVTGL